MIFTDRTIMVKNGTSSINDTIVLYRGDRDVEIRFTLNEGTPFKFGSGSSPNIIEKTEATYGQLVIKTPGALPPIFSEVTPTIGGKIIFTITAEMIDETTEVGNYTFQIRLLDDNMESRATLPEVKNGIEIREPIALEDVSTTNEVNVATVGYALTTAGTTEDTFDAEGNYNKTTWGTGDRITAPKLNKMEAGIDGVNKKLANTSNVDDATPGANTTYSSNKIESIKEVLNSQINEKTAELTDARIGADGNTYDNLGTAVRTQLTNINTRMDNLAGQEIKAVFKERQLTLGGNQTSNALLEEVVVGRKYILLIKDGTEKVSLALDKDNYGNGRSLISSSHNGYAINETTATWAKLYIYNMNDVTWTGTICLVDITDNTELEQYLIANGYDAVNDGWKGVLPELRQNLDTVYREKINIYKADDETTILEKFKNAYNTGNCDVVFEPGTYTFSDIFNHVNEEIPIGCNCHYYFNGSTIVGTKPESISTTKNMFGSLRTGGNYELYDGILIGNSLTYIIHDEADADKEMYTRKYHNMIIQNNTGNNTDTIRKCIGAGTGCHGVVEIDSCVFLADYGVDVSYHGIDGALDHEAEFILTVKNSYFNKGLRLDGLGKNQKGILIYSGNNMQPNEAIPTGWTVYEFNNGQ